MSSRTVLADFGSMAGFLVLVTAMAASSAQADQLFLGSTYGDVSQVLWFDTQGSATSPTTLLGNQAGYMRDLSVNPVNGRMYWACHPAVGTSYVRSADLNGTGVATITVAGDLYSMTADRISGSIFYGSNYVEGASYIRGLTRMGLDGSAPQLIATIASGSIGAVEVAQQAGKVYWANGSSGIRRSNLDGSNSEDVITGQSGVNDIAVDEARGLIYWASGDKILRAPADGSGVPTPILSGMAPLKLALSPDGNTIYFGNGNYTSSVYKMNSDGSGLAFVTSVYKPVAIDVLPEPSVAALLGIGSIFLFVRRRR